MAETLVPERKGDDPRRREERIADLLDDPEKLRELHRRQIERREARKAARQRRKGRHQGSQHAHVDRPGPEDSGADASHSASCPNRRWVLLLEWSVWLL